MGAVRAGQVFDGLGSVGPATVVFEDGRITAVEKGEVPGAVDLGDDGTLLPGLVAGPLHLALDASMNLVSGMDVDDETLLTRMTSVAQGLLAVGVTTVRDLGDKAFLATEVRTPLTVLASGPPLTTPQGHCWFLGGEMDSVDAMLKAVQAGAERGCAVVKVMVSGGNITPGSTPFDSQFDADQLRPVVAEAHRLGLQAAAHAHAWQSVEVALDAGFDTLEHATFMDPQQQPADEALLRRTAESGVVVSMTPGSLPGSTPPPHVLANMAVSLQNLHRLYEVGARMMIGTDGGVSPGKPHALAPYLPAHLTTFGWTPAETLVRMTSAAADGIGLGGRKGVLARGADADLLAVRGNPLVDPATLHDVVGVWAAGTRLVA